MLYRRHRRRRFPAVEAERSFRFAPLIALVTAVVIVFYLGAKVLDYFGVGNTVLQAAVSIDIDERGVVNVSLDGNPMKRADSSIKLYPGDAVESTSGNSAAINFFDGTTARMNENARLLIEESLQGEEKSEIAFALEQGSAWILTPEMSAFSGSIKREVSTPDMQITLTADAEVFLGTDSLTVFSSEGLGIAVSVEGMGDEVFVGEGQQLLLPPEGDRTGDLYAYRQPIDLSKIDTEFVEESRSVALGSTTPGTSTQPSATGSALLTVVEPTEGTAIAGSTVLVTGRYGVNIERVRINGYLATLNADQRTFSQELALPDEESVTISIEAVDTTGLVAAEVQRTITRDRKAPDAPAITEPAATGTTYKTNDQEFTIEGTAAAGTVGVVVNDYRLQLFEPGDTSWSYLAALRLENLKEGENLFTVYAIGSNGQRSEPATMTIIVGQGNEGVVSTAPSSASSTTSAEPEQVDEGTLPANSPTKPGTLSISQPGPGTTFETSQNDLLIEGNVDPSTDSVWINGYKLRLYEPGKNFFNYIANEELGTLKPGKNEYIINARDAQGNILDTLTYTITFTK